MVPLVESDYVWEVTGPVDRRFVWEFDNPSNYTLQDAIIDNGTLLLSSTNYSFLLTTQQDFENGTLTDLDSYSIPGELRLVEILPDWYQDIISLNGSGMNDTYISDFFPFLNYGGADFLNVGNDGNNCTYRPILQLNSYALAFLPSDATGINATLSLYGISGGYPASIYVNSSQSQWNEGYGDLNKTLGMIMINETEGINRTNEPIVVNIPLSEFRITNPNSTLILFDEQSNEHPSRILNESYLDGNLTSIKLGFSVSNEPNESLSYSLKHLDSRSFPPSYRNVSNESLLRLIIAIDSQDYSPALIDSNKDGILDILACEQSTNTIYAFDGLSTSTNIITLWSYDTDPNEMIRSFTISDVDLDGDEEIILTIRDYGLKVLDHDGQQLFDGSLAGITSEGTTQPVVADINLDGIPEIVITDKDREIVAVSGVDGSLVWMNSSVLNSDATDIAIGDFNSSPGLEIALSQNDGIIFVIDCNGTQIWSIRPSTRNYFDSIAVADINDDGLQDILFGENDGGNGALFAIDGRNGSIIWEFRQHSTRYSDSVAIADLDNDGEIEIITLGREAEQIVALAKNGTEIWNYNLNFRSEGSISIADYDADGFKDIFIGDRDGKVTIVNGSGQEIEYIPTSVSGARINPPVILGDLDGDSSFEMVAASSSLLSLYDIPGFSMDWRMDSRDAHLSCNVNQYNSPENVAVLNVSWQIFEYPIHAVNWTHATNSTAWLSYGGDFNSTSIDTISPGGSDEWYDINITSIIQEWIASNKSIMPSIFLIPENNSQGITHFASTENGNTSRHPILTIGYNLTRYSTSYGLFTSDIIDHSTRSYWTWIRLNATTDAQTNVTILIRSGNSTNPDDGSWRDWEVVTAWDNTSTAQIEHRSRYVQVRANLTTGLNIYTPALHSIEIGCTEYASEGNLETEDAISPEDIKEWNRSWAEYQANGGWVLLRYSTDSGNTWFPVPTPSGNISAADPLPKKIKLRIELTAANPANTPVVFNVSASYKKYQSVPEAPEIYDEIEDQIRDEDFGTWQINLTEHIRDPNEPQTSLRWYVTGEELVQISGENITGNMIMNITTKPNATGIDTLTFVVVDSTSRTANQSFNITLLARPDPPAIYPAIPDIQIFEDLIPPYELDLSPYLRDGDELQSELKWYVENESIITVLSENDTGNMIMNIQGPVNVYGTDFVTLIVEDSTGLKASQNITITILSVNDPPVIEDIPDFTVRYDLPYEFDFSPYLSDIETPIEMLNLSIPGINSEYVSFNGLVGTFILPESLNNTIIPFQIQVDDGEDMDSTIIEVFVSNDYPPEKIIPLPDVIIDQGEILLNEFNLFDHFLDIDNDALFFVAGNVHVQIVIDQATGWTDFYAPNNWYGTEDVIFRAIDEHNARVEDAITITVIRVIQPPIVEQIPNLVVKLDLPYSLDLRPYVSDPDTPIEELDFSTNMGSNISFIYGIMTVRFTDPAAINTTFQVQLSISDDDFWKYSNFTIRVGDDSPPTVGMLPDHMFVEDNPQDYPNYGSLENFFFDIEESTNLTYSAEVWTMNITPAIILNGQSSIISFSQVENWFGETYMTVRGMDHNGGFAEYTIELSVLTDNDVPTIESLGTVNVIAGIESIVNISSKINDVETPVEMLLISSDMSEYINGLSGHLIFIFPRDYLGDEDSITEEVVITVRDLDGAWVTGSLTVVIEKNPEEASERIYLWWLLGVIGAISAALAYLIVTRFYHGPFIIHDMMLIHNNGMLLARLTRSDTVKVDDDIFSGMLTAVLDFVDDAFVQNGREMKRFDFKDYTVTIKRGQNSYVCVAYSGVPSTDFDAKMTDLMNKIEKIFGKHSKKGLIRGNKNNIFTEQK